MDNLAEFYDRIQQMAVAHARPAVISDEHPDILGIVVPEGFELKELDMEQYGANPRLASGRFTFTRVQSFLDYIGEIGSAERRIFATEQGAMTCFFDAHGAKPGWHQHVAEFVPTETPSWKAWVAASGRQFSQVEFAEFLTDRITEIAKPDGATLHTIATTLKVKTNIDFQSGISIHSGQVNLVYQEQLDAGAGPKGDIAIPETLTLVLTPYEGGEPYEAEARFRFRASGGKATFQYHLGDEISRITRAEASRLATIVGEKFGPVLFGAKR
ncbi:MAG: DUF2303 family protein [Dehalococcoidia bacterium]|nr:DUF2303 family protein [Dehalococcoidia bacterium]